VEPFRTRLVIHMVVMTMVSLAIAFTSMLALSGAGDRRAMLGVGLTVIVGIAVTLGLGAKLFRDLRTHVRRSQMSTDAARRAISSRQELLGASSELRGPVETILQRTASLRGDTVAIEAITAACEQLQRTLESLLDVTAVEEQTVALSRERCDTSTLIDVAATSIRLLAAERAIHVEIDAPIPVLVYVDRRRLLHALGTLLGTAVRTARPGGEIVVTARPLDGEVRVSICETGADPHPGASEAASMGLLVSRRMIEAHGGRFGGELSSSKGIWFHLPTEPQLLRDARSVRPAQTRLS